MTALDPITAGIDLVSNFIDRFVPDKDLANKLKAEANAEEFKGNLQLLLGQMDINKQEAASTNWFVAGWRPFIGWVCGLGLAYVALIEPLARFIAQVFYRYAGPFPAIDTTLTMQVLIGMLGLGTMRTWEKSKNVEGNR